MTQFLNKLRILIVDDSISIRSVLRALLHNDEYEVVGELASGAKLIPTIANLKPHIICLDYNLPDTDGLTLLNQIHANFPQIAVVMITGSNNPELEHTAAEAGTAGFIYKPFSQAQIIDVLHKVAHAQRLLMIAAKKRNPFEDKPFHATAVVADDSQTLRRLLIAILSHMGVQVVGEAHHGKQAVELVSTHKPDIVCLDFEMPVMNGLEAMKIIRNQNPLTKTVMITALASRDIFNRATSTGAQGYIIKPFHPDKVTQNISRILAC
ncbi:MAG: histidine kinase [Proteobacteria bacterium SG_bin4]|nr:MAG: histidine kinase [Proteobacteria bacterium SG_bin4]